MHAMYLLLCSDSQMPIASPISHALSSSSSSFSLWPHTWQHSVNDGEAEYEEYSEWLGAEGEGWGSNPKACLKLWGFVSCLHRSHQGQSLTPPPTVCVSSFTCALGEALRLANWRRAWEIESEFLKTVTGGSCSEKKSCIRNSPTNVVLIVCLTVRNANYAVVYGTFKLHICLQPHA